MAERKKRWTSEDDRTLCEEYRKGEMVKRIAERVGRSANAVCQRMRNLGLMRMRNPRSYARSKKRRKELWALRAGGSSVVHGEVVEQEAGRSGKSEKRLEWGGVEDGPPCMRCNLHKKKLVQTRGKVVLRDECARCGERHVWADYRERICPDVPPYRE